MYLIQTLTLASLASLVASGAAHTRRDGTVIVPLPRATDTSSKNIPDADHPYVAPGSSDLRGPCPGLNTLANHGYLPRNGIASFEQIVTAVQEGFNMEYDLASALAGFGMLARGNAYTNQLSIGGPSELVPPLPDNLDGNVTKGLATHGRFEGDVSMTRRDAAIGDNVHFDQELFNQILDNVALYGDDSDVTGPKSIVNVKTMQEFKYQRFLDDVDANPELVFHAGRMILSYGEAGFTLNFFANGTDGKLSVPTMTSIFRDQRFPENWFRRSSPADLSVIGASVSQVFSAHPVTPGANINGTYVPDTDVPACAVYSNLASENLAAVLLNTTGVLKQNVDTLIEIIHKPFSACELEYPSGPAGV